MAQELKPVYKRVDTCAAEFESFTPYLYSSYEPTCESNPNGARQGGHPRQRPEPDRAGHRVRLLLLSRGVRAARGRPRDGDDQLQPGDGLDRLRHRRPPVLPAADVRRRDGGDRDASGRPAATCRASCSSAGRRRSSWRSGCRRPACRILGTSPDSIDLAEDRKRFAALLSELRDHAAGERHGDVARRSARGRRANRLPGRRPAVVRARRPRHGDRLRHGHARSLHDTAPSMRRRNIRC